MEISALPFSLSRLPRRDLWILAALLLGTLLLYARALTFQFVNFDDPRYVYENSFVTTGLSAKNIQWAFEIHGPSMWVPFTWLSHQAMWQAFGNQASWHHTLNVVLHLANVGLFFGFIRRIGGTTATAALAAALFAWHPLHVESVAWVTERKDVLAVFFCLLALHRWLNWVKEPRWWRYLLVFLAHAAAVMSKPLAVTLPCVMLLLDWCPLQRLGKRALVESLPLFALSGLASWLTVLCQVEAQAIGSLEAFPLSRRLANAAVAYGTYLRKLVWPTDLAPFYPYPASYPTLVVVASLTVLMVISLTAWLTRKKHPWLMLGWLWFLGTLVPMVGIVQAGAQSFADRYTYFPMLGIYLAVGWAFGVVVPRHFRIPIAAALCAGMLAASWRQVAVWRDSETLFRHAIRVTKDNYVAHNNLGIALQARGQQAEAEEHYRASLAANHSYSEAMSNLGVMYANRADLHAARTLFEMALQARPGSPEVQINLARALEQMGDAQGSIDQLKSALDRAPQFTLAHFNLGNLYLQQQRWADAEPHYLEALRADPTYVDAWVNLALVRQKRGDLSSSQSILEHALKLQPGHAEGQFNLGLIYQDQGRLADAEQRYRLALTWRPAFTAVQLRLGSVLAARGDWRGAAMAYDVAIKLDPSNAAAWNDLGQAVGMLGQHQQAKAAFERCLQLQPANPAAQQNLQRASEAIESARKP